MEAQPVAEISDNDYSADFDEDEMTQGGTTHRSTANMAIDVYPSSDSLLGIKSEPEPEPVPEPEPEPEPVAPSEPVTVAKPNFSFGSKKKDKYKWLGNNTAAATAAGGDSTTASSAFVVGAAPV